MIRRLSSFVLALVVLPALFASIGCGSTTSSPTSPTTVSNSYALLGKVPAAVSGVPQSFAHIFLLPAGATMSLTLTSATEVMLDGSVVSTVPLGVGLGTVTNGVCTVLPGAFVNTASATSPQMAWPMPAGTDCVLVSDVTVQEGAVSYAITLTY